MPYIIKVGPKSTAVATLEEARALCTQEAERTDAHWYSEDDISESGSVGPLPDATMIEVENLSPLMLASKCGASGELVMSCVRADDFTPLIAAFNTREVSS